MPIHRPGPVLAALAASLLAGCNAGPTAPAPKAMAALPAAKPLPEGKGCSASVARTQALVDSDLATGNIDEPVAKRFTADLGRAAEACSAGRDGEGLHLLAAAKARYGYR